MSESAKGLSRAVFLDRDGVLNRALLDEKRRPIPPRSREEFALLPGATEACQRLKAAGFRLVCVTNQPDLARGTADPSLISWINATVAEACDLDQVRLCPHDDHDGCHCRKPKPGMLLDAASDFGLNLAQCVMIGDRFRDIEAGQAAGCKTVLVDYRYAERAPSQPPDLVVGSLAEAADRLLGTPDPFPPRQSKFRGEQMITADALKVKLFADGADRVSMMKLAANPAVSGFTTNPTLMNKAGIKDYEAFARDILSEIRDRPISLEVFSDDLEEMYAQAEKIATWGDNVYIKIPVTNTKGESTIPLLRRLAPTGTKLNVTALFTIKQVEEVSSALADAAPSNISVFAGRIADAGVDPLPTMKRALEIMKPYPQQELIWASPREVFNVVQANEIGCHIITATSDIIAKLPSLGKDLEEFSLDTVKMFRNDALAAGYSI